LRPGKTLTIRLDFRLAETGVFGFAQACCPPSTIISTGNTFKNVEKNMVGDIIDRDAKR
jgi:hypothetical protein